MAEEHRFCAHCSKPVGRSRVGVAGPVDGVCDCGHPFSFAARLSGGEVVAGQYEVVGCLAHGGMGWVYLAHNRRVSDRWVVLKGLINKESEVARAAALTERDFLAKVDHPDIVKIYNFVTHDDEDYIVMEYVNGMSLRDLLASRRRAGDEVSVTEAISFVLGILPALGHLHDVGLLYCDLKPSNIMQSARSIKLIDLGGVRRIDDHQSRPVGTPGYMAPEIDITGPSVASDLYTAGRTLAVLSSDEPSGTRWSSLQRLLDHATAVEPEDRFESAEDLAAQLRGILHEIVPAEPGTPRPFPSNSFEAGGFGAAPDWRALPRPLPNTDDPSYAFILSLGEMEPADRVIRLDDAPYNTREVIISRVRAHRASPPQRCPCAVGRHRRHQPRGLESRLVPRGHCAGGRRRQSNDCLDGQCAPAAAGRARPKARPRLRRRALGRPLVRGRVVRRRVANRPQLHVRLVRARALRRALGDATGATAAYDRVPSTSSDHAAAQRALAEHLLASGRLGDLHGAERVVCEMPAGRQRTQLAARGARGGVPLAAHRRRSGGFRYDDPRLPDD